MKKRILCLFLALIMLSGIFYSGGTLVFAKNATTGESVVVFTSDVHHTSTQDNASAKRLKLCLEYVTSKFGEVDALGVCGDLGYKVKGDTYWSYVQRVMDNVSSLGIDGIYTTGNHEHENGGYSTTTNQTAKNFTRLGLGKKADNYEIYCFGAASVDNAFSESDITALTNYLEDVGTEKPVFILSHYPLHKLTYTEGGASVTRDPTNREKVIELLNQYPNVFFIWGHNHSKNDPHYDAIHTDSIDDTAINFTYAGAGAMTDSSENLYAGNITGMALIALISENGKQVSLCYIDKGYNTFSEWENTPCVKYTVSFDANGGQGSMDNVTVKAAEGESCKITAPKKCTFSPPEGKHFAGWSESQNGAISDQYTIDGDITLYAVWADGTNLSDVTMVACANPQAGLDDDIHIRFTENGGNYSAALLLPGDADTSQIRLSWPDGITAVSDGTKEYAKGEAPIASDGSCVSYTVTAADGTATFTIQTVCEASCIIDKSVSLQEGQLTMLLNGTDTGKFIFAKSGSGWTIQDENGKYLAISNKALTRSSSAYTWTYASNKFSASVKSSSYFSRSSTYYLTLSSGSLAVSTSNKNNTASFRLHQENKKHTYVASVTEATCTAGGYTTYTCECGASYIGNHTDPVPHTYTPVVTAPTCTEEGYTTYTCQCGDSYVDNRVQPTGHHHTETVTAPTCSHGGYTTHSCQCGDNYVTDITDPIDHNYVNGRCTMCGGKDPSCKTVCEGTKSVSLQAGELTLLLNGTDMGKFVFAKSGSGWTIQDENGKYLSISSKALTRSSSAYTWTYTSNKFSASVKSSSYSSRSTTYYLTVSSGSLAVSTSNKNNTASFAMYVESDAHSFGEWTFVSNGKHSRTCSVCGETEVGDCTYDSNHRCTECGAYDPSFAHVSASVAVTSSSSFFSRKTTYKATITTTAIGTTVKTVQYSTDNSTWKTGTTYSSSSAISKLYVRITDEQGNIYNFLYSNGTTTAL